MRIVVGADEKNVVTDAVVDELRQHGDELVVLQPEAWPDVARRVAEAVASGTADQGMLFCWTGTGTGSYSGSNNPASITMSGPITETATFTHN